MGVMVKAARRLVETLSLSCKQSADLNGRLARGQVSAAAWARQAAAIWSYNLRNFWNPEPDPVLRAEDLVRQERPRYSI